MIQPIGPQRHFLVSLEDKDQRASRDVEMEEVRAFSGHRGDLMGGGAMRYPLSSLMRRREYLGMGTLKGLARATVEIDLIMRVHGWSEAVEGRKYVFVAVCACFFFFYDPV